MKTILRFSTFALLVMGVSAVAFAQSTNGQGVPEISPAAGMNAIALLAGAALVVRNKFKK